MNADKMIRVQGLCVDFYATQTSRNAIKNFSNDIEYIFVGFIVSETFVKTRKLLTLIIHGKGGAVVYKKKYISHSAYPLIRIKYRLRGIIHI